MRSFSANPHDNDKGAGKEEEVAAAPKVVLTCLLACPPTSVIHMQAAAAVGRQVQLRDRLGLSN